MSDQQNSSADAAQSPVAQVSAVSLRLADDGQLLAELTPDCSEIPMPVSIMSLRGQLQDQSFAELWIDDDALQDVVVKAASGESGVVVIGERRDAKAEVHIANNKRVVHVDIEPAYGGQPLSVKMLRELLKNNRIAANCIDSSLLEQAVAGQGSNHIVARAIEPIAGQDGYLNILIEESVATLDEDAQGNIDFHKLQEFVVVEQGVELARVAPHTLGTPGEDVLGMPIAPQAGKPFSFSAALTGAAISDDDDNLLIATVKGHPVILQDGVSVDPTLVLPNVNLASGNIDFDGSVLVKGSVASGYEIRATGDVVVKDTVDKATIIAGGNISVANGIIGEDRTAKLKKRPMAMSVEGEQAPEEESFETLQMGAYLEAAGDIVARFVNMAELKTGQNIEVREYLMHSRVSALGSVLLGQKGGRGAIFGGYSYALKSIAVNNLGNDAYIKTAVEVGELNTDGVKLKELHELAQKRRVDTDKLATALDKIRRYEAVKPLTSELAEKAGKITKTLAVLIAQSEKLAVAIAQLEQKITNRQPALVTVKKMLYPNVSLTLDGLGYQQKMESKALCLMNVAGEVQLSALQA
ncbi:FapA family protein [Dasania marina]|uniref:DUF342 domain-containing protein n=1 Tax=Dasania marina TaxID=471499 RepID=UPI0030DB8418